MKQLDLLAGPQHFRPLGPPRCARCRRIAHVERRRGEDLCAECWDEEIEQACKGVGARVETVDLCAWVDSRVAGECER